MKKIDRAFRDEVVAPAEFELADRIIVQSEYCLLSFVEEGFSPERLFVLPRAVDFGVYAPGPAKDGSVFRVLFVGMVSLRKGILDLLQAWRKLALPRGELWIVGKVDNEISPLLCSYRDDPSIRFFGHAARGASDFYSQVDAFALPSIVEGSAKTNYEAMAAGLPVITTLNAGSVVRDGVDGFIVPIRDPDVLAEKIRFLFESPDVAEEMGRSARQRVAEYSWDHFEAQMIGLYRDLPGAGLRL